MTGQIPHSFIEDLLARTDIVEIISARVNLRRAGANYIARCPFHTEKTPSFSVNHAKQFYHCFGCGASGDAIRFLTEHDGLHFLEAIEFLASRAGLTVPLEAKEGQSARFTEIYEILQEASLYYQAELKKHPLAKQAHHYLKSRGLTGQIAKQYSLGFAPPGWDNLVNHLGTSQSRLEDLLKAGLIAKKEGGGYYDRFRERVMFPILDRRGRVVGFGGRVIAAGEPKYLNSPETPVFNKGSELYGLFEARSGNRTLTNLLVVEGYIDVVSLAQAGIKNAVATLGTAITSKHVEALFRQASELVFCFDGDKAGKEAAKRTLPLILPLMKEGRRVHFMLLPEGEDPDSYVRKAGVKDFLDRIQRAATLSDFLFDSLSINVDLNHLDGRAQLITLAKPLIKLVPEGVLQRMLYERLAELASVDSHIIYDQPRNKSRKVWSNPKHHRPLPPPTAAIRAAAMLLKKRELLSLVENVQEYQGADTPGTDLLCAIIAILRFESSISLEAVGERLPADFLSQFSFEDFKNIANSIPELGIEQEFLGAMQRLRERAQEQAMESLLIKAKTGVLSLEEKAHLKNLLDQREKNRVD